MLAHLDRAPFAVRPCTAADAPQLAALQAACRCELQRAPLDGDAIGECIAAQGSKRLTWIAEVWLQTP